MRICCDACLKHHNVSHLTYTVASEPRDDTFEIFLMERRKVKEKERLRLVAEQRRVERQQRRVQVPARKKGCAAATRESLLPPSPCAVRWADAKWGALHGHKLLRA